MLMQIISRHALDMERAHVAITLHYREHRLFMTVFIGTANAALPLALTAYVGLIGLHYAFQLGLE